MDVAVTQYLLGIRPMLKGIVIDPAIPGDWDGYKVTRVYRGCRLNIEVRNPNRVQHGVKTVMLDGVPITGNLIVPAAICGKEQCNVTVFLG